MRAPRRVSASGAPHIVTWIKQTWIKHQCTSNSPSAALRPYICVQLGGGGYQVFRVLFYSVGAPPLFWHGSKIKRTLLNYWSLLYCIKIIDGKISQNSFWANMLFSYTFFLFWVVQSTGATNVLSLSKTKVKINAIFQPSGYIHYQRSINQIFYYEIEWINKKIFK